MSSIGFKELIIILVVILIIFGGRRLPELGKGLGKGLNNFRKAVSSREDADDNPDSKAPPTTPPGGEPKA
jgi:sec-independent protein translocase protein TatA